MKFEVVYVCWDSLSLYNYWRPNLIASLPNAFFLKTKFNKLLKENIDVISSVPSCIELSVSDSQRTL